MDTLPERDDKYSFQPQQRVGGLTHVVMLEGRSYHLLHDVQRWSPAIRRTYTNFQLSHRVVKERPTHQ